MKNKKFVGTVMVPAMLHMFVFIVIPIVIGLVISFFNYNPLSSDNKFIGLENFVRLVQDADFRKALLNTLLFVLITVTLNIGIALVVAQMISWFKSNKVRSFFRMVFFLPCIAPMVATSVVFARSIFPTTTGFLNVALNKIGIDSINWLGDPKVVMISLIIYTIWVDVGYNVILFSAGIDGIPSYVYEAADLDGASEWVKFLQDYMAFARKKLSVCHCTDVDLTFSDVCAVCSAHFERRPSEFRTCSFKIYLQDGV